MAKDTYKYGNKEYEHILVQGTTCIGCAFRDHNTCENVPCYELKDGKVIKSYQFKEVK